MPDFWQVIASQVIVSVESTGYRRDQYICHWRLYVVLMEVSRKIAHALIVKQDRVSFGAKEIIVPDPVSANITSRVFSMA